MKDVFNAEHYLGLLNNASSPKEIEEIFGKIRESSNAREVTDEIEGKFIQSFRSNFIAAGKEIDVYVHLEALQKDNAAFSAVFSADDDNGRALRLFWDDAGNIGAMAAGLSSIKGADADLMIKVINTAFAGSGNSLDVLMAIMGGLGGVDRPENAALVENARKETAVMMELNAIINGDVSSEKVDAVLQKAFVLPDAPKIRVADKVEGALGQMIGEFNRDDLQALSAVAALLELTEKMPPEIQSLYRSQVDVHSSEFQEMMGDLMAVCKLALFVHDVKGGSDAPLVRAIVGEFSKLSDEDYNDPFQQAKTVSRAITEAAKAQKNVVKKNLQPNPFRNKGPGN